MRNRVLALGLGTCLLASCGLAPSRLTTGQGLLSASSTAERMVAKVETIAGGHSPADSGYIENVPAIQARYTLPNGLAYEGQTLFVSDAHNEVVRTLQDQAGTLFSAAWVGNPKAGSDQDGVGAAADLNDPQDIASGPDGTLYFVEHNGNAIRSISKTGEVRTLVNNLNVDKPIMKGPYGIAVGKSGALYVVDLDGRAVFKVFMSGGKYQQQALYKAKSESDPTPMCVTVDDSENVYFGSYKTLYKMTCTGANRKVVVDRLPQLAWDLVYSNRHLYVAAAENVLDVDLGSGAVQSLAGNGKMGCADGVGDQAAFGNAEALCLGAPGTLYVADGDNHRICKLTLAAGRR